MGGGSLFGLIMLIGSIVLYALGRLKPEIRRDSDIIYVCVGILYGLIAVVSVGDSVVPSWVVEFQNLLAIGCIVSLMWQNIRDRQAKPQMQPREGAFDNLRQRFSPDGRRRGGPMDDPRAAPANNVYRYEASLDDYDRFGEPRRDQRRIRGSEPPRGGGYGDRYDEPGRRPSLNDADRFSNPGRDAGRDAGRGPGREPGFDDRGRDGRGDFPGRGNSAPNRPERGPRRNDWEDDNYVDGRRSPAAPPKDGFGPERNPRGRGSRPRDERSMEGRPLSRPLEDDARQPLGGPGAGAPSSNRPNSGPNLNGPGANPPLDRPPLDMPPRRRPRPNGPADRPGPDDRQGPGSPRGNRPNRRPDGDRPVIDATPATPAGNRPMGPPPGNPMPPLDVPVKDDYVDFKPVTPPPDSERDNSDQFDD